MSSLNCQNYIITQKPVANSLNSVTSSPQTNPHHSFLQSVHTVAAALHPSGRPQSVTDHLNTGQRERSEHPTNPHPASAELHRRGLRARRHWKYGVAQNQRVSLQSHYKSNIHEIFAMMMSSFLQLNIDWDFWTAEKLSVVQIHKSIQSDQNFFSDSFYLLFYF